MWSEIIFDLGTELSEVSVESFTQKVDSEEVLVVLRRLIRIHLAILI